MENNEADEKPNEIINISGTIGRILCHLLSELGYSKKNKNYKDKYF